jgi:hypothetical protein
VAVKEFHEFLARSPDTAVAVAAIKALTTVCALIEGFAHIQGWPVYTDDGNALNIQPPALQVIRLSTAQTMMGLANDLEDAAAALQRSGHTVGVGRHPGRWDGQH